MGPYPVGFDTMAYYVPTTLLWLHDGVTLWSFLATAPMLYSVTSGLAWAGGSITLILKVLPPLLLGFLGFSIYLYARVGLLWSQKKSLLPALIGTLYFVALRISWDALREEFALIFFFLVLTLLVAKNNHSNNLSWKKWVGFSLALVGVVLSNQVVAVLLLGVLLFTVVYKIIRKNHKSAATILLFSLPAVLIFFAMFYFSPSVPEYRLIFGFPTTSDGWLALFGYPTYSAMLTSEAEFIVYCFLPLLPLAVLSVTSFKNLQMRSWIILILIATLIPFVSPSDLRLVMLLTYPLAFYVTEGLSWLGSLKWKRFKLSSLRVGLIYLTLVTVVLSLGFMILPPENPFPYFAVQNNPFLYSIPTSMLQNTVSIADCKDTTNALQWLKGNITGNAILLSHRVFYGWCLLEFKPEQVVQYEFGNPADAATVAHHAGDNQIYLIWWVNGKGWDGQSTVASVFHQIYQSGEIAIYQYVSN